MVTLEGITKRVRRAHVSTTASTARLERGQRIAVVGANGAGKTTLLKMVAGELAPDAGKVTLGHNVVVGYYAQHHADKLDRHNTILEEVRPLAADKPESYVRGVLGAFLFSGDDVEKPIGVLSGGERARVALAKLLLVPSNLLLMDEPTNHLDLDSSEMLIEALKSVRRHADLRLATTAASSTGCATHVWEVRGREARAAPGQPRRLPLPPGAAARWRRRPRSRRVRRQGGGRRRRRCRRRSASGWRPRRASAAAWWRAPSRRRSRSSRSASRSWRPSRRSARRSSRTRSSTTTSRGPSR